MDVCCICKEPTGELVKVTERGIRGLIKFSQLRKDLALEQELMKYLEESKEVCVHEECRKWFNNKRRIENNEASEKQNKKKTRNSTDEFFNWKASCFICSEICIYDSRNPKRKNWNLATTFQIRDNVLQHCDARLEKNDHDELALQVKSRLLCCIDLIAAEARYHTLCMTQFRSDRSMDKSKQVSGRPKNETLSQVFEDSLKKQ